uniref:Uncharacterized protein n=1 Tax=Panagrolaimus sp. JU765 TaxID=591449 RepID=A0AC34PVI3_9BILA
MINTKIQNSTIDRQIDKYAVRKKRLKKIDLGFGDDYYLHILNGIFFIFILEKKKDLKKIDLGFGDDYYLHILNGIFFIFIL